MKQLNKTLAFTGGMIACVCLQTFASNSLTLDEAIHIALEKNPELIAARQQIQIGVAEKDLASRLPNPEAEANADEIGSQADSKASVWVRQPLLINGQRGHEIRAAELKVEQYQQSSLLKSQELVLRVKSAYSRVLFAQDMAENASQSLQLAKEVERVAKARFDAQVASSADVMRAGAEYERVRVDAEQAEKDKQRALYELAHSLGVNTLGDPTLKPIMLSSPLPMKSLLERLDESPTILQAKLKSQVAEADCKAADAGQMANPEIGVGYIRKLNQGDNLIGTSIGWSLPLFGRNQAEMARAKALVDVAKSEETIAKQELTLQLRQYYSDYQFQGRLVALYRTKLIPAAQESFRQLALSYRYGRLGYLDLLDAKRRLIEAREGLLQARYQQNLALFQIEALFPSQEMK